MSRTIRQEDGVPEHFTGRVDYTTRFGNESHYYLLDGEKVDGVTTITKGGLPRPEALQRWDRKQGAEAAIKDRRLWTRMEQDDAVAHIAGASARELKKAAARGTEVHAWAEEFAATGALPTEVPEELQGRAEALKGFLTTHQPRYLLAEKVVFNPLHLYAGTFDAIAWIDGLGNTLIDYKTAKRVYPENALQLAAYRYSTFWIDEQVWDSEAQMFYEDPDQARRIALPRIDACAVVLLHDDGTHSITPVQADRVIFGLFLKAKEMYGFSKRGNTVIGKPLTLPST